MNTCRLCKKWDEPLFKYGVRHYAHAGCAFKKWGIGFLDMIPRHMIGQLPYQALVKAGALKEAEHRIETEELEQALHTRFEQGR